jgi:hypothetical protein
MWEREKFDGQKSKQYINDVERLGTWVVLPQPVSPEIRTTWQEKQKDQITISHQMAVKENIMSAG